MQRDTATPDKCVHAIALQKDLLICLDRGLKLLICRERNRISFDEALETCENLIELCLLNLCVSLRYVCRLLRIEGIGNTAYHKNVELQTDLSLPFFSFCPLCVVAPVRLAAR